MRVIYLLLFAFVPPLIDAQSSSARFQKTLPTQEKVYVHMDNNAYVQGDTVWYNAYVVRADDNSARPLSRILYVELLDE